ncbi:MAG: hypothetical protein AABX07_05430 [Nanoarchaeota archaeon]
MEYRVIKIDYQYNQKNKKIEVNKKLGRLEFSLTAIEGQEFRMPYVCH